MTTEPANITYKVPKLKESNTSVNCLNGIEIPFHCEWKIPNYKQVYENSKPGSYLVSDPILAGKLATLILFLFPKGVKNGKKNQNVEVYLKLMSMNRKCVCPYISYFYGYQSVNNIMECSKFAVKSQVHCGEACLNNVNIWMPAEKPTNLKSCLRENGSLLFIMKGVLSYNGNESPVKSGPSNIIVTEEDEIMIASSISETSHFPTDVTGIATKEEELYLKLIRGYPKWSDLIADDDDYLTKVSNELELREYIFSAEPIIVSKTNICGLLLASDICQNENVKKKCLRFIRLQGPDFFQSEIWSHIRKNVPELHQEVIMGFIKRNNSIVSAASQASAYSVSVDEEISNRRLMYALTGLIFVLFGVIFYLIGQ